MPMLILVSNDEAQPSLRICNKFRPIQAQYGLRHAQAQLNLTQATPFHIGPRRQGPPCTDEERQSLSMHELSLSMSELMISLAMLILATTWLLTTLS